MEKEIVKDGSVDDYKKWLRVETLYPLLSVSDMSQCPPMRHMRYSFGVYAIYLKEVKCGDLRYGRHYYDYQEGTVVCIAPGQVVGGEDTGEMFQPNGWALLFHPDLIRGTLLGQHMKEYTFFSYESNEALHLSERERAMVVE